MNIEQWLGAPLSLILTIAQAGWRCVTYPTTYISHDADMRYWQQQDAERREMWRELIKNLIDVHEDFPKDDDYPRPVEDVPPAAMLLI
jgi:hypothetical protein